jgi:predicted Zn-dependent protease
MGPAKPEEETMAGTRGMFGRRTNRGGFGLVVVTATWASVAWVATACGESGEEVGTVVTTVAAATEPVGPVSPPTTPAVDPEPSSPVETEPTVPSQVTYGDAETVYRSGKYHDAMELFSVFALRHPENAWGHYMLGLSSWKAGELERAERALARAVELSPDHVKGLINLARVLLDRDRPEDALARVEKAVELDAESPDAWRVMGNALSDMGENDESIEAYRNALSLDGKDVWSMNNMGLVLIRQGRHQEALPPLARATALAPKTALFQNNLGVALERSGYPSEAAVAFRAALEAQPEFAKAQVSLVRVEAVRRTGTEPALDLAALAASFAEDVASWQHVATLTTDTIASALDSTGIVIPKVAH